MGMEREDLRVELSIARRRQQRMENQNSCCNMEVVEGIHSFEDILQKTAPPTNSRSQTDANLVEATRVWYLWDHCASTLIRLGTLTWPCTAWMVIGILWFRHSIKNCPPFPFFPKSMLLKLLKLGDTAKTFVFMLPKKFLSGSKDLPCTPAAFSLAITCVCVWHCRSTCQPSQQSAPSSTLSARSASPVGRGSSWSKRRRRSKGKEKLEKLHSSTPCTGRAVVRGR